MNETNNNWARIQKVCKLCDVTNHMIKTHRPIEMPIFIINSSTAVRSTPGLIVIFFWCQPTSDKTNFEAESCLPLKSEISRGERGTAINWST